MESKNNKKAIIVATVSSMIQQFNLNNIRVLQEKGFDITVACNFLDSGNSTKEETNIFLEWLEEQNIESIQIDFPRNPSKFTKIIKSYKQLNEVFSRTKYDLMHCHAPVSGVLSRISCRKNSKTTRIIYTAHGFHFHKGSSYKSWLVFYPVEKFLSRVTDILITINKEDYQLALKKLHSKKTLLVPGIGIDTTKFYPVADKEKQELRRKNGFSENDFILTFVGELNSNKNQEMIIEAVKDLRDEIENLKVLLVGKGVLEEKYKSLITLYGLEKNIFMLGFRTDVNELLQLTDISISSSKREGLPVNLLESMAVGNPMIATDCRGNRDVVKHGKNGYLVDINDIESLNSYVVLFYNNKYLMEKYKEMNLEMSKEFTEKKITEKLKMIY